MNKPLKSDGFDVDAELGGVYRWLDKQCNDGPILQLIQEIQKISKDAKKQITVGQTKPHRLHMLRRAVSLGLIEVKKVYELLESAEEHGRQRVYLYKPRASDRERIADGARIAESLFGDQWGPDYFPSFEWPAEESVWADFRIGVYGKPRDWVAKIYSHSDVKVTIKNSGPVSIGDGVYQETRTYQLAPAYMCHVVRWRHPNLLEVRVDKELCQTQAIADERFQVIAAMIAPAIDLAGLPVHKMQETCEGLWKIRKTSDGSEFKVGQIKLLDKKKGVIKFHPEELEQSIDDDLGRSEAVDRLLTNGARALESQITWKFSSELAAMSGIDELPVVIGGDRWNELVIGRRITREVYDYVFKRLCGD